MRARWFSIGGAALLTAWLGACGGGGADAPELAAPASSDVPQLSAEPLNVPTSSYAAGSFEAGAWVVLQQARQLCGFGTLTQNAQLDAAAASHARYLTSVSMRSGTSLLSHFETDTSDPFYTGYYPWDRTSAQGYGDRVAEILEATVWDYDINHPPLFATPDARGGASMLSLLNTVYHLSGAMYDGADVGFGADLQTSADGSARREEYRFASLNGFQTRRLPLGAGVLATYPCEGSIQVPSAFVPANESPNPFPNVADGQRMGPPIYLKVDAGQTLTLASYRITRADGAAVASTVLFGGNDAELGRHEVFVVPLNALQPYTYYEVELSGRIDNRTFNRRFTLQTGA